MPAAVARLGVATTGLAVLWTVAGTQGYGRAGAAAGAFAIADAVAGPQLARLIDRWGQRRVVSVSGAVFAAAGLALALTDRAAPAAVVIGLAAAAGATLPPVGALAAARWRAVAPPEVLPAALSAEGAVNDAAFLIGPVLATTGGLPVAVGLVAAGLLGLLTANTGEPPPAGRRGRRPRAVLFAVNLEMGLYFGGIGVAVTASAGALGGPIMAVAGVVSLGAGLAYGAFERGRPARVMLAAGLAITAGCALLALAPNLATLLAGYALVGGCVALVLIPASVLLQPATVRTMTWMNSASALGIAVAAPVIGRVVERHGPPAGFLALAGLTATLPLTLLITRRSRRWTWRRRGRPSSRTSRR
nr:MFS transporter [Dactylosporangium thailandense]